MRPHQSNWHELQPLMQGRHVWSGGVRSGAEAQANLMSPRLLFDLQTQRRGTWGLAGRACTSGVSGRPTARPRVLVSFLDHLYPESKSPCCICIVFCNWGKSWRQMQIRYICIAGRSWNYPPSSHWWWLWGSWSLSGRSHQDCYFFVMCLSAAEIPMSWG